MVELFAATAPIPVQRRLTLAMLGRRYDRGAWIWYRVLHLAEEQLDTMDDAAFATFVTAWTGAAVSNRGLTRPVPSR
jgi:hypothetical protein